MNQTDPVKQRLIHDWTIKNAHRIDHENGRLLRKNGFVRIPNMNKGYKYHEIKMGDKMRFIAEHQLIWVKVNGPIPAGLSVDHINRDSGDNRIVNLRLATSLEQKDNSSRCKIPSWRVIEIVTSTKSNGELAEIFNTTKGVIANVKHRYKKKNSDKGSGDV